MSGCTTCGGECAPECGRHPAGCVYGGLSEESGYWLQVDGCPLDHAPARRSPRELVARFMAKHPTATEVLAVVSIVLLVLVFYAAFVTFDAELERDGERPQRVSETSSGFQT